MKKQRRSNFRGKVAEDARRQASRKSFGYLNLPEGIKALSLEEDMRVIQLDFLPYEVSDPNHPDRNDKHDIATPGSLWYKRPFKVHRNVGVNNDTVICLTSIGKRCPICEYVRERLDKGEDWDDVKEITAKQRNLYIVIPVDTKGYDEVPYIWDMSQFLFQDVLNEELAINEENDVFPDLEEGRTAVVKLKWETFGRNTFPKARDIAFEDRKPYKESILDELPNLDELLTVLSYEEVKNKFFEFDTEETADEEVVETRDVRSKYQRDENEKKEEEEEETKREPSLKRSRRDEEDEEEPEKEEKKPVRTRPVKKEQKTGECPEGHTFGEDWDNKKECKNCEKAVWDACGDEYDKLSKEE